MKTLFLFWAAILTALVISLPSCNNQEQNSGIAPNEVKQEIGVQHNECLDLIYKALQAIPKTRSGELAISQAEIDTVIKRTTVEYVRNEYDLTKEYMPLVEKSIDNQLALNESLLEEMFNQLSPKQKELYGELDLILTDDDSDMESLQKRIAAVKDKAYSELQGEDLDVMLSAISVAENTLYYWQENYVQWINTQDENQLSEMAVKFQWKALGKADFNGCAAAAVGGGVSYLLGCGPVGWKAWAAVCLSGAVAGSVENAIDQLW